MSDRFGIPGHAPQHAPDHAQQNPTPQGNWGTTPDASAPMVPVNYASGGGGYVGTGVAHPPRKSFVIAIVLAMLTGPFSLFYVSFLNGVAALILLPAVAPWLRDTLVPLAGTSSEVGRNVVIVGMAWALCVPWAVLGVWWRNSRLLG